MNSSVSSAWYRWPEPNSTNYFEADLRDPREVKELFDYCQILLANITKEGCRFLIKTHGFSGLLAINKAGGWFDEADDQEAVGEIPEYCLISGYDPDED